MYRSSLLTCFLLSLAAWGAQNARAEVGPSLSNFELSSLWIHDKTGLHDWSFEASWNPRLAFQIVELRGKLGFSVLNPTGHNKFAMLDYEILGGWQIVGPLWGEAGGGYQTWIENGGLCLVASANLVYEIPAPVPLFDRLTAGYSRLFRSHNPVNEFRVGIGLTL